MSLEIYTIGLPTPFLVGKVNVYLLRTPELTLIDAGPLTEEAEATLESEMKNYGFAVEQIKRILITHGHQDHFGLAERLAARSGARIFLPQEDRHLTSALYATDFYRRALTQAGLPCEKVKDLTERFFAMRSYSDPIEAYQPVTGGDVIPAGNEALEVLHTPGHTPGSVCYYLRREGVLFAGDTLLKTITPNPMLDLDPTDKTRRFMALVRYLETLKGLLAVETKTIYPGHRGIITDYPSLYQSVLGFYHDRQRKIMEMLQPRAKSAYEVSLELFPRTDDINRFLAVSEVLANIDVLKHDGQLQSFIKEEVEYFAPLEPHGNGVLKSRPASDQGPSL